MSELLKSMTARVVGVSFDNDDGTSRQDIISGLSVGEALLLNYHEYENEQIYILFHQIILLKAPFYLIFIAIN